jgi:hypothetical protein
MGAAMDSITAAIIAAAPVVTSELVTSAVKDAYGGVKTIIRRKWGRGSAIEKAIESAEAKPASKDNALVLGREVASVRAEEDGELIAAVRKLAEALKQEGIGASAIKGVEISISGGVAQGIIGATDVRIENLTFGSAPKPPED